MACVLSVSGSTQTLTAAWTFISWNRRLFLYTKHESVNTVRATVTCILIAERTNIWIAQTSTAWKAGGPWSAQTLTFPTTHNWYYRPEQWNSVRVHAANVCICLCRTTCEQTQLAHVYDSLWQCECLTSEWEEYCIYACVAHPGREWVSRETPTPIRIHMLRRKLQIASALCCTNVHSLLTAVRV
jgi:hypothetical protein